MKKNKLMLILALIIIFILVIRNVNKEANKVETADKKINTVLMLIEFERIEGILQWEKELDERQLSALIKVQDNILEEYPEVFQRLAAKGYEIAGGYDEAPFWNMSYEEQYQHLKASQDLVESITGKKMRVFGSRYFAYDETTLKAASDLGIDYILGRGVNDVEATIYQAEEYSTKIISVTNVDVGEPMGRGSLCDYSLWARGAGAEEFGIMLSESLAKNPDHMILVSHSYLGGTRLEWWKEYEKALNSEKISWKSFDEWLENQSPIILPNNEIPVNDEINYLNPVPAKAMEDYEPIPGIEEDLSSGISEEQLMCF